MRRIAPALAALALCATASPAFAQSETDTDVEADAPTRSMTEGTVFDGDWVMIGVGAGYVPEYDGSDDYKLFPLPLIRGSVGGIGIEPRAAGAALDLVPDGDGKLSFAFGPTVRVRTSRTGDIKDPVVAAAGKLDTAWEVGGSAGVSVSGVLNPYDSLGATVDVRWDVAGAHEGRTISPSISYFTPVSRGAAVSLSVSAEHGDENFNSYYFSVTPAQALASGLPAYDAGAGFNKWGVNLLGGYDLDGDLTNGGFGLFAIGGYSRMIGDAADSPFVADRGSADQWMVGGGIGYTF